MCIRDRNNILKKLEKEARRELEKNNPGSHDNRIKISCKYCARGRCNQQRDQSWEEYKSNGTYVCHSAKGIVHINNIYYYPKNNGKYNNSQYSC